MIRMIVLTLCAMTLAACDKAPATPTPAVAPAAPAAPAAVASPPLIYDCISPQKSGTVFMRFADDGTVSMGADVHSMKPTGNTVKFDESGQASWDTPNANGYDGISFSKPNKEMLWQSYTSAGIVSDQATYSCKPM